MEKFPKAMEKAICKNAIGIAPLKSQMRKSLSMNNSTYKRPENRSFLKSVCVKFICIATAPLFILSCEQYTKNQIDYSDGHINSTHTIQEQKLRQRQIPKPVKTTPFIPAPETQPLERYSVNVQDVPIRELLFAISRDAKIDLDIKNNIDGNVTLNANNQTLPQILDRISNQTDIRYNLKGNLLLIESDKPYLKHYTIDYLNVSRESESIISTSTGINNGVTEETESQEGNTSTTSVTNRNENRFWDTLSENITYILDEAPEPTSSGSTGEGTEASETTQSSNTSTTTSSSVIINRESGVIYVRATSKQHADIQRFLDKVLASARRQVLIEATVAEVTLNDQHQLGVDWASLADNLGGFSFSSAFTGDNFAAAASTVFPSDFSGAPAFNAGYRREKNGRTSAILLKMLDQYGDVKVLSSPKIMALNNQTSLLKVVDNKVYFSIDVEVDTDSDTATTTTTYDTTAHSVPVGFIMNVTPFITEAEEIILNIRPTLTRIVGYMNDPNPALAQAGVTNPVPEVQIREMESVLRVNSGNTAVIGGLMQDSVTKDDQGLPWISKVPILGNAFTYKNNDRSKTELVIFLKPTLIKNASIERDLMNFRRYLPNTTRLPNTSRSVPNQSEHISSHREGSAK